VGASDIRLRNWHTTAKLPLRQLVHTLAAWHLMTLPVTKAALL